MVDVLRSESEKPTIILATGLRRVNLPGEISPAW
jgi:hypothetical protein